MTDTSHPIAETTRILLDVGAHYGETLDVALNPRWCFTRVVCFEPSGSSMRVLGAFRDARLQIVSAGLSNVTRSTALFGAGTLGASIYADKPLDARAQEAVETIDLLRASDWIRTYTAPGDAVYLKLNCEGSECDVLEDLLGSDMRTRIAAVYVDFDVRKIPSQAHREGHVREALAQAGVAYVTTAELGCHGNRAVEAWLSQLLGDGTPVSLSARLRFALRLHRPFYVQATAAARRLLPRLVFHAAARLFGNQGRFRRPDSA
jgi:FkbM family methyltransferase